MSTSTIADMHMMLCSVQAMNFLTLITNFTAQPFLCFIYYTNVVGSQYFFSKWELSILK